MSPDDEKEMERLRRAWPDAEPPVALDRAVRLQAYRVLAQRRAALATAGEAHYPAWLLGLTAALAVAFFFACALPGARSLLAQAWRSARSVPFLPLWLALATSNLLAAAVAPVVATWRRSHAS